MADECLEGCPMISQHQYTPLLFGVCLIHAALQSVPTLENDRQDKKSIAVVRYRAHSLPTIYKGCAVNREAFSIIRKTGMWVLGEVHSLVCDEVDQTFKMNKREVSRVNLRVLK